METVIRCVMTKAQKAYVKSELKPRYAKVFIYYVEQGNSSTLDMSDKVKIAHELKITEKALDTAHKFLVKNGWVYTNVYHNPEGTYVYVECFGKAAVKKQFSTGESFGLCITNLDPVDEYLTVEPIRLPPAI
jgi:hypothetical protein